jgi:hypothetical protein
MDIDCESDSVVSLVSMDDEAVTHGPGVLTESRLSSLELREITECLSRLVLGRCCVHLQTDILDVISGVTSYVARNVERHHNHPDERVALEIHNMFCYLQYLLADGMLQTQLTERAVAENTVAENVVAENGCC